jgi:hypothetical protein
MKRKIGIILTIAVLILWGIRYTEINHGLTAHWEFPRTDHQMNETVTEYGKAGYLSFHMVSQPGCSITVNRARLFESGDYLADNEISPDVLPVISNRYLELNVTFSNTGDDVCDIHPIGLHLIGSNWFSQVNQLMTALVNPLFRDDLDYFSEGQELTIQIPKGKSETLRLVYSLNSYNFLSQTWDHLDQEEMWLLVTMQPEQHRIVLKLSDE